MAQQLQVPVEDPKRFRIEMTFSRGADINCLEVILIPFKCYREWSFQLFFVINMNPFLVHALSLNVSMQSAHDKDSFLPDDHTMQIMEPERLQEVGSYLTLDKFDKMTRPFAMPAEDFPPATPSQCLAVRFCKDIELQGARLVNLYPCSCYQLTY